MLWVTFFHLTPLELILFNTTRQKYEYLGELKRLNMENTVATHNPLNEQEIINFLSNNNDFFLKNSDVLEKMTLPSTIDDNIASFNDFQNRKLAQKINKLENRNKRLITTAIQNIESTNQINNLTLALLNSTNKVEMLNTFMQVIKNDLKIDSANIILRTEETVSYETLCIDLFKNGQSVCLRTATEESPCLHEAENLCIRSEALIHLTNTQGESIGLLTLGSADIQRFHEGQGSELLEFLGGIISYKLQSFLAKE